MLLGVATMSGGRDFGPTDWPGHDAQGERIEGGEGVDVKVGEGFGVPNRCLVLGVGRLLEGLTCRLQI